MQLPLLEIGITMYRTKFYREQDSWFGYVQNGINFRYSSGNIESAMQVWISEKKLGLKIRMGEIIGKECFQTLWTSLKCEHEMYGFLEFRLM